MKTLKRAGSEKGSMEYLRVKDVFVPNSLKEGYTFCSKVEWKTATKGYGKTKKAVEVKKEVDHTEGIKRRSDRV